MHFSLTTLFKRTLVYTVAASHLLTSLASAMDFHCAEQRLIPATYEGRSLGVIHLHAAVTAQITAAQSQTASDGASSVALDATPRVVSLAASATESSADAIVAPHTTTFLQTVHLDFSESQLTDTPEIVMIDPATNAVLMHITKQTKDGIDQLFIRHRTQQQSDEQPSGDAATDAQLTDVRSNATVANRSASSASTGGGIRGQSRALARLQTRAATAPQPLVPATHLVLSPWMSAYQVVVQSDTHISLSTPDTLPALVIESPAAHLANALTTDYAQISVAQFDVRNPLVAKAARVSGVVDVHADFHVLSAYEQSGGLTLHKGGTLFTPLTMQLSGDHFTLDGGTLIAPHGVFLATKETRFKTGYVNTELFQIIGSENTELSRNATYRINRGYIEGQSKFGVHSHIVNNARIEKFDDGDRFDGKTADLYWQYKDDLKSVAKPSTLHEKSFVINGGFVSGNSCYTGGQSVHVTGTYVSGGLTVGGLSEKSNVSVNSRQDMRTNLTMFNVESARAISETGHAHVTAYGAAKNLYVAGKLGSTILGNFSGNLHLAGGAAQVRNFRHVGNLVLLAEQLTAINSKIDVARLVYPADQGYDIRLIDTTLVVGEKSALPSENQKKAALSINDAQSDIATTQITQSPITQGQITQQSSALT